MPRPRNDTRLIRFPTHVDESHALVCSEIGEGMDASVVVWRVLSYILIAMLRDRSIPRQGLLAWFLLRSSFIILGRS
ncbi:hypothetical protein BYT27DRAFT_6957203 [Phlegmacium glaucopus]|nr:hypothetical protein BYT27DRAFT_6957203 [Phlegmacium glaucopus]